MAVSRDGGIYRAVSGLFWLMINYQITQTKNDRACGSPVRMKLTDDADAMLAAFTMVSREYGVQVWDGLRLVGEIRSKSKVPAPPAA
jgi:hypothetical protein